MCEKEWGPITYDTFPDHLPDASIQHNYPKTVKIYRKPNKADAICNDK